jgi:hypothetical protein
MLNGHYARISPRLVGAQERCVAGENVCGGSESRQLIFAVIDRPA